MVWLDCSQLNLNGKDINDFMIHDVGLGFNNGSTFGTGGDGFVRMNVACPKKTLEEALVMLEKAVTNI